MKTLQLLSAGPRRQASARTSAESDEACQRKTKDRADGLRGKSAHCPRWDSNLYPWDTRPPCCRLHHEGRARLASVETNTLDTHPSAPPRNNHAWKHSNSYLRDRDVKHLQGPPLSRTKRVRERRKIELTVWGKKSAHCPRRDSNLYLWDTRPPCCRLHHEGRARRASVETNTLDTHPSAPPRNNHAWKHSNSYLRDRDVKHLQGPPLSRTKRVRERRKIELTVWGKKVPIALDGIQTCTSGIRAHRAADYTTKA